MALQLSPFQLPNRPTLTPQNLAALPKMGPPDMVEANMKGMAGLGTAFEGAYERARERGAMDQLSEYYRTHPFAAGAAAGGGGATAATAATAPTGAPPSAAHAQSGMAVYQGLVDRGIEPHVAAGMAGNVYTESRFKSDNTGDRDKQTGQPTAIGYAQWRGSRQQGLFAIAQQRGTDWKDPEAQLDHMVAELKGPYAKVYQAAVASGNPGAAAAILAKGYEKPADWALRKTLGERTGMANSLFALGQQGGGGGPPVQVASAAGGPVPAARAAPPPGAAAPPPAGQVPPGAAGAAAPPPVGLPPPDPTPDNIANAKAIMQQPTSDPRLKEWAGTVLRQQPGAAGQVPTASLNGQPGGPAQPGGPQGGGPGPVPPGPAPGPQGGDPATTGSVAPAAAAAAPAATPPLPPPDPRRVAAAAPGAVPSRDDPIVAKANAEIPASVVQNVRQRFNQASPEERAQMIGPNANPLGKAIIQNPAITGTQGTAYDKKYPTSYDPSGAGGLDIRIRPTPSGAVVGVPGRGQVFMPNEALAIAARGNPQVFAAMLREYGPNGAGNKGFGFAEVGGVLYRTDPQSGTAVPITPPQTGGGEELIPPGDPRRPGLGILPNDNRTYKTGTDARGKPTIAAVPNEAAPATVDAPGGGKAVWNPQTGKFEPLVIPGQDGKAPMFNGNSVEGQALNWMVQNGKLTPAQAADLATGKTVTHPDGSVYFFRGSELIAVPAGGSAPVVPGGGPAPAPPAGGGPAPVVVAPGGGQPGIPAPAPGGGPAPLQPAPEPQPAPAQPAQPAPPTQPARPGTQLVPPKELPPVTADTAARLQLGELFLDAYLTPTKEIVASGRLSTPVGRAQLASGRYGEGGQVFRWIDEGSEGLVRVLTGAGMPESEAARYRNRYTPSSLDDQRTMVAKVEQLERILRRTVAVVKIGHKMSSQELDQLRAEDRAFGQTYLGEKTSPGGQSFQRVD